MLLYTVSRVIAIGKGEGQWNEKGRLTLDDIKEIKLVCGEHLPSDVKPHQSQHSGFYKQVKSVLVGPKSIRPPPLRPSFQARHCGSSWKWMPFYNLHKGATRSSTETASWDSPRPQVETQKWVTQFWNDLKDIWQVLCWRELPRSHIELTWETLQGEMKSRAILDSSNRLKAGGEGGDWGQEGWMASPTQWR